MVNCQRFHMSQPNTLKLQQSLSLRAGLWMSKKNSLTSFQVFSHYRLYFSYQKNFPADCLEREKDVSLLPPCGPCSTGLLCPAPASELIRAAGWGPGTGGDEVASGGLPRCLMITTDTAGS